MPPNVANLLTGPVLDAAGAEMTTPLVGAGAPEGRQVALYFSASWCPPCRRFTPQLAEAYAQARATDAGRDFEVVFVSWDEDRDAWAQYAGKMPWARLPFQDPRGKRLTEALGVRSIPTLVLLDADGAVANPDARGAVAAAPGGYPWPAGAKAGAGGRCCW